MTQRGNERVAARQRARARRLKLDADRIAREERVDAAVAEFELSRAACDDARLALDAAEVNLGRAVTAVLAEGEPVDRVAALCELNSAEVRRLSKLAVEQAPMRRQPTSGRKTTPAPSGEVGAPTDAASGAA